MQSGSEVLTQTIAAGVTAPGSPGGADGAEVRALRELCHDLIEPASSIKLLAHAASAGAGSDPVMKQRLRLIAAEARRIADICGQMLNRPGPLEPIRLDELTEETVASARLRYRGAIDVVSEPVLLGIHPAVVVRILNNLLANACRAAGDAGRVQVVVAQDANLARLSVADTGGGLRPGPQGRASLGLEIIGSLALGCGGSVHLGVSDFGGLCVTVILPCPQPADSEVAPR